MQGKLIDFLCTVILRRTCNLFQPKCNSTNAFELLMEAREKQYTEGVAYHTMQTQWLPKFLRQNYDWIKMVLKPFIEKKKQDLQEYLEHVITENYKCDEVGLFLFARMFHIQIGVIVNGVAWTTHFKQDLKQCDFVLGYKGCCQFVLLEKLQPDETVEDGMRYRSPPA